MAQNRPPPAFQEYAANMIASVQYRTLSLPERGLLYSMRLECWVNQALPEKVELLAKVLGYSCEEVRQALPAIMPFFAVRGAVIVSPELEDYRAHLAGIRDKQSSGGKRGAAKTNEKRKGADDSPAMPNADKHAGDSQLTRASTRESLAKPSSDQPSKAQPVKEGGIHDDWLGDYDAASNGR